MPPRWELAATYIQSLNGRFELEFISTSASRAMPKPRTMATTARAKSERPVGFTTPESASTEDTSSSDPVDDDNHDDKK